MWHALDTMEIVLDGVWRIASTVLPVYFCAKFPQPKGKAFVVISQQEIIGSLLFQKHAGIPILSPVLEQANTHMCISSSGGRNETYAN